MNQQSRGTTQTQELVKERCGYAPERSRTSTPLRAQALNLPRMPIPPPGQSALIILSGSWLSTPCMSTASGHGNRRYPLTDAAEPSTGR